jgi:hypothetical protein
LTGAASAAAVVAFASEIESPFATVPCFGGTTVPPFEIALFTWFCVAATAAPDDDVTSWFSREPTIALTADSSTSVLRASSRNLADAIFRDPTVN